MRQTRKALVLTALSCSLLAGCSDDGVQLSLQDGYEVTGWGNKQVAASMFRMSTGDLDNWMRVKIVIPDEAVGGLPLKLDEFAATCTGRWRGDRKKHEVYGKLRILEARHDGLFAEYAYPCDGKTVKGKGLFEALGPSRDGVWDYPPEPPPSTVTKLLDSARYMIDDLIYR